jgi:hypothetical protein
MQIEIFSSHSNRPKLCTFSKKLISDEIVKFFTVPTVFACCFTWSLNVMAQSTFVDRLLADKGLFIVRGIPVVCLIWNTLRNLRKSEVRVYKII